jgi:GNAT superfamily N-acetyltransferase
LVVEKSRTVRISVLILILKSDLKSLGIRRLGLKFWISWQYMVRIRHKSFSLSRFYRLAEELDRVRGPQPTEKCHLQFLGVSPRFQRRGIGRKLLEWGCEKADHERIPIYLEATAFGRPLYESVGFTILEWMALDDGHISQAVMRRTVNTC